MSDITVSDNAEELHKICLENTSRGHNKFYDVSVLRNPEDGEHGAYYVQATYGRIGTTGRKFVHTICYNRQSAYDELFKLVAEKRRGGYEDSMERVTVDARSSFRRPEPKPKTWGDGVFYSVVGKNLPIDFNVKFYYEGKYVNDSYAVTNLLFTEDKEFTGIVWARNDAVVEAARRQELLEYVLSYLSAHSRGLLQPHVEGTPYAEVLIREDSQVLAAIRARLEKVGSNPFPDKYVYFGVSGKVLKTHDNLDNVVPISRRELRDMLHVKKAIRLLEV